MVFTKNGGTNAFQDGHTVYGASSGFSTETGERGLKAWAKHPSKTTQKRGDAIFSKQVCQRIHERVLIDSIADCCPLEEDIDGTGDTIKDIEARCANFVVELGYPPTIIRVLPNGKKHKHQLDFPMVVLSWFSKNYGNAQIYTSIQLFTEVVVPQQNGGKGL